MSAISIGFLKLSHLLSYWTTQELDTHLWEKYVPLQNAGFWAWLLWSGLVWLTAKVVWRLITVLCPHLATCMNKFYMLLRFQNICKLWLLFLHLKKYCLVPCNTEDIRVNKEFEERKSTAEKRNVVNKRLIINASNKDK